MKLSDLEDADKIVTKEYLDAKLGELKASLLEQLIASERGQRLWIWGLYGLVIVLHAATWAAIVSLLLPRLK